MENIYNKDKVVFSELYNRVDYNKNFNDSISILFEYISKLENFTVLNFNAKNFKCDEIDDFIKIRFSTLFSDEVIDELKLLNSNLIKKMSYLRFLITIYNKENIINLSKKDIKKVVLNGEKIKKLIEKIKEIQNKIFLKNKEILVVENEFLQKVEMFVEDLTKDNFYISIDDIKKDYGDTFINNFLTFEIGFAIIDFLKNFDSLDCKEMLFDNKKFKLLLNKYTDLSKVLNVATNS